MLLSREMYNPCYINKTKDTFISKVSFFFLDSFVSLTAFEGVIIKNQVYSHQL